MKLPGTLDLRRRLVPRDHRADGHDLLTDDDEPGFGYFDAPYTTDEHRWDDPDAFGADDGWEWVEVDDEDPDAAGGSRPTRSSARGRSWIRDRFGFGSAPAPDGPAPGPDLDVEPDVDLDLERNRSSVEPRDRDDPDPDGAVVAVDPRIAARRDDVAHARRTRLQRRAVAVAIVVGLLAGLALLTRSAALDVDRVAVTGTVRTDPAAIAAASGIAPGTPLLGLDLDQALARVQAEPWVRSATIDRTWSGVVSISIVEREPVATINAGAGGWLQVDAERRVVAATPDPPALPIIDGVGVASVGGELAPDAQAAIDVARALTPGLRTRVAVVDGSDPRAIELTLQPTGTVHFGPATALDERIRSLQTVFAQVDLLCLDTIDLQVPDTAVLTRVPACA